MPALRFSFPVLCLASLLLSASACKSPPHRPDPSAQPRTNDLLRSYPDEEALSRFVGAPADECVKSSRTTELCQWSAGKRMIGWRPMARAIGTRDWVNLICELPLSGEPRAFGSCSIHPRRSNRYSWKVPPRARSKAVSRRQSDPREVRERYRRTADQWIANAGTLVELSRLMGAAPADCMSRSPHEQVCTWLTTSRVYGQGTLAIWIDASKRKKIRLRCFLPKDGSDRQPDSCSARVGSSAAARRAAS